MARTERTGDQARCGAPGRQPAGVLAATSPTIPRVVTVPCFGEVANGTVRHRRQCGATTPAGQRLDELDYRPCCTPRIMRTSRTRPRPGRSHRQRSRTCGSTFPAGPGRRDARWMNELEVRHGHHCGCCDPRKPDKWVDVRLSAAPRAHPMPSSSRALERHDELVVIGSYHRQLDRTACRRAQNRLEAGGINLGCVREGSVRAVCVVVPKHATRAAGPQLTHPANAQISEYVGRVETRHNGVGWDRVAAARSTGSGLVRKRVKRQQRRFLVRGLLAALLRRIAWLELLAWSRAVLAILDA